jgi:hypothetical protein
MELFLGHGFHSSVKLSEGNGFKSGLKLLGFDGGMANKYGS